MKNKIEAKVVDGYHADGEFFNWQLLIRFQPGTQFFNLPINDADEMRQIAKTLNDKANEIEKEIQQHTAIVNFVTDMMLHGTLCSICNSPVSEQGIDVVCSGKNPLTYMLMKNAI